MQEANDFRYNPQTDIVIRKTGPNRYAMLGFGARPWDDILGAITVLEDISLRALSATPQNRAKAAISLITRTEKIVNKYGIYNSRDEEIRKLRTTISSLEMALHELGMKDEDIEKAKEPKEHS